jgi:hypothetical protein
MSGGNKTTRGTPQGDLRSQCPYPARGGGSSGAKRSALARRMARGARPDRSTRPAVTGGSAREPDLSADDDRARGWCSNGTFLHYHGRGPKEFPELARGGRLPRAHDAAVSVGRGRLRRTHFEALLHSRWRLGGVACVVARLHLGSWKNQHRGRPPRTRKSRGWSAKVGAGLSRWTAEVTRPVRSVVRYPVRGMARIFDLSRIFPLTGSRSWSRRG